MTDPALIAALSRMAEIAGTTDRAVPLREAAARLAELAADGERLDFIEADRVKLAYENVNDWWCVSSGGMALFYVEDTARDAIDAAMRGKDNADG